MRRWNPSRHPRDKRGRFRGTNSVDVSVGLRRVSVTAQRRVPLGGRASVTAGAFVRAELAPKGQKVQR